MSSLRDRSLSDLYFFAKAVLGYTWLVPHIHLPLCLQLERYMQNRRLGFVLPRGWLKSTICSIAYPIWRAIRDPNVRVLVAQNTFTNACKKLAAIRAHFERNGLFRALFPGLLPDGRCTWKAESACVKRTRILDGETFEAAGTGTQVTSRHFDVIIQDDTVAPELDDLGEQSLCPTQESVQQAIGWHNLAPPLLVNAAESQIIVVGTRWFEHDLMSWIKDHEPYYQFYERACVEDPVTGKPSDEGDLDGVVAYPERFDQPVLDELRASMGPYMFSCLYQNMPLRRDDMLFRQEWFQYYELESTQLVTYTTVDPAGDPEDTKSKDQDWNVVLTCGKDLVTGNIFVLNYSRKRCSPSELISTLFDEVRRWHPVKVGIEAFAYQKSLLSWVRERMQKEQTFFLVEPFANTRRSKGSRIMGLQPFVHGGVLKFRAWMTALVNELLSFPHGKGHDDLADALAMQLPMWALTKTKREAQENELAPDSVGYAMKELEARGRARNRGSLVFDVLEREPAGLGGFSY
jgi:predicted phage terminase large subunit-like protein